MDGLPGRGRPTWPIMMQRHQRSLLLAATLSVILIVTLIPSWSGERGSFITCPICEERGLADVVLNILLFVPFGLVLGQFGKRQHHVLIVSALLSAGIEFAQSYIPGRDAAAFDIVFNTAGAAVGVILARRTRAWLLPSCATGNRLSLASAFAAVGILALVGYLLGPAPARSSSYTLWTPRAGLAVQYEGEVVNAVFGTMKIVPPGTVPTKSVTALLTASGELRVQVVPASLQSGFRPVIAISDEGGREIVLLGLQGDDLVFRYRTRSASVRLDRPDFRFVGAMRDAVPGKITEIAVLRESQGYCMSVDEKRACTYGFTVGDGWALLLHPDGLASPVHTLLASVWLAVLFLPGGYWAVGRWVRALSASLLVLGLLVTPQLSGLLPTRPVEIAAGLTGFLSGIALRRATETIASQQNQRGIRA